MPGVETPRSAAAAALMDKLSIKGTATDALSEVASGLAAEAKKAGVASLAGIVPALRKDLENKKAEHEGAFLSLTEFATSLGQPSEPFLIPLLDVVLVGLCDKQMGAKKAAEGTIKAFAEIISPHAIRSIMPVIVEHLATSHKWQTVVGALTLLQTLLSNAPEQVVSCLPELIPAVVPLTNNTKGDVSTGAREAMNKMCESIDNKDLEPLVSVVLSALINDDEVEECVHKLAATTFVQSVTAPALAIVSPILLKGFRVRKTAVKRQAAVIVSNMSKLVEEAAEAAPFLPPLIPLLLSASEEISDPEARGVCEKGWLQLNRIKEQGEKNPLPKANIAEVVKLIGDKVGAAKNPGLMTSVEYMGLLVSSLVDSLNFDEADWVVSLSPLLSSFIKEADAKKAIKDCLEDQAAKAKPVAMDEEEDDAEELCNCKFTLAYGSKILLHNTNMVLKRGLRYGLLGGNDSGKTTLMRAIANGQVEGFPSADELRTVFVEADIREDLSNLPCVDYVLADPAIKACGSTPEEIKKTLLTVGFTEHMATGPVTFLSGGWRMKLALARAMLQRADILLLDEPTNHLDVINVKWTMDYLMSLKSVTSIIVSHDTGLLDTVCTNMMQIMDLKLQSQKGNLSEFVKTHPEAMCHFQLKSSKLKFKFPQPGFLEGVKSKGKALMTMKGVEFTYPVNDKPTISDINVQVSMSSRVACVGVNGAGKSTMIKLLTGELEPCKGAVWKHQAARIAYVAQHAFVHIEKHLDKSANEYIRWRYQNGEDKETLNKASMTLNEEEEKQMSSPVALEFKDKDSGKITIKKEIIERFTGARQQHPKTKEFEYEVAWAGKGFDANTFVLGRKLEAFGSAFIKNMKNVDTKIAARAGMYVRPLTTKNVEEHIADVGLEPEYGTHHRMAALSGGQKVKVVLAAAMWDQPHILILDEPTNYLDRESLGALSDAIKEYGGGVVMITHNNEFCSELCPETWVLEGGKLNCKGDADWMKKAAKEVTEFVAMETMVDAAGNVSKVKAPRKQLSRAEKKKKAKIRAYRIANGEEVSTSEEDM